jgi:toxin ParE1/3/4
MATRQRRVVWTDNAQQMLDDAVAYLARDSRPAAERLLIQALDAASSLDVFSERGRVVPEFDQPNVRELLVQRYRLLYEVSAPEVQILAFIHGARDLTRSQLEG